MARRGIPFGQPARARSREGPRRPRVLTVREAVELANRALEQRVSSLWVEGEVSNLVLPRSGHAYFTLKDEAAALPVAMWATSVRRLRFRLEEGQRLRVFGRMGIYSQQGRFQLYADRAEPAGLGELTLALEQLKRKLAAEGLFASERKRPIPRWPRTVGVITSPSGAAIHDIIKVIRRRMPTPVLLCPAPVQGPEAPQQLTLALRRLQRQAAAREIDVIIIGRGGGSMEDLWSFNHEGLARAIASCPIPVGAAIGHEADEPVGDLVAERRAATPSQAGELVVADRRELLGRLAERRHRLVRKLERRTLDLGARLHQGSTRVERWGRELLRREREHLARSHRALELSLRAKLRVEQSRQRELAGRLAAVHPRARIEAERASLRQLQRRLDRIGRTLSEPGRVRLARAAGKLDALSPLSVLGRGYALVRRAQGEREGEVVRRAEQVETGEALRVTLGEGELSVEVRERTDRSDARGGPE